MQAAESSMVVVTASSRKIHVEYTEITTFYASIWTQRKRRGIQVRPQSVEEAKVKICLLQKEIKSIIQQAKEKHDSVNRELASIHDLTGKVDEEKALKSIISAEKMSTVWKKVSYTDSKKQSKPLTSLQILASWPPTEEHIDSIKSLEKPMTASEW
eukprot:6693149-Ditylum_brightwellii.AAC.1